MCRSVWMGKNFVRFPRNKVCIGTLSSQFDSTYADIVVHSGACALFMCSSIFLGHRWQNTRHRQQRNPSWIGIQGMAGRVPPRSDAGASRYARALSPILTVDPCCCFNSWMSPRVSDTAGLCGVFVCAMWARTCATEVSAMWHWRHPNSCSSRSTNSHEESDGERVRCVELQSLSVSTRRCGVSSLAHSAVGG